MFFSDQFCKMRKFTKAKVASKDLIIMYNDASVANLQHIVCSLPKKWSKLL